MNPVIISSGFAKDAAAPFIDGEVVTFKGDVTVIR